MLPIFQKLQILQTASIISSLVKKHLNYGSRHCQRWWKVAAIGSTRLIALWPAIDYHESEQKRASLLCVHAVSVGPDRVHLFLSFLYLVFHIWRNRRKIVTDSSPFEMQLRISKFLRRVTGDAQDRTKMVRAIRATAVARVQPKSVVIAMSSIVRGNVNVRIGKNIRSTVRSS